MLNVVWRLSSLREHWIDSALYSPHSSVLVPPVTNDVRDHHARNRSQARCDMHAPQSSGARPHPGCYGCFDLPLYLSSFGPAFVKSVYAAEFKELTTKNR